MSNTPNVCSSVHIVFLERDVHIQSSRNLHKTGGHQAFIHNASPRDNCTQERGNSSLSTTETLPVNLLMA
jgi:hypothetical protein